MTIEAGPTDRLGLRERKKLATRRNILDAAWALFAERGFDHVTVVEIADAVDLSAKTVFAYFPSKEDLIFDGEVEVFDAVLSAVRDREPGSTPLEAMTSVLRELAREMAEEPGSALVEKLDQLLRAVASSATLQSRMRLGWENLERGLADVLDAEAGGGPHSPAARVVAAQLVMLFRLLCSEHIVGYLRAHSGPSGAALEHWLDTALALVGGGVGDYGRRTLPG